MSCFPGVCRDLTVRKGKNAMETARIQRCLFSRVWGLAGGTEMAILIISEFIMQFALNVPGTIFFSMGTSRTLC